MNALIERIHLSFSNRFPYKILLTFILFSLSSQLIAQGNSANRIGKKYKGIKVQNVILDSLISLDNNKEINSATAENNWLLKGKKDGIEIYSKWFEVDHFIVLKIKNTTNYKSLVTFKPVFKCTNTVEKGTQSIKHLSIDPLRTIDVYLEVKCDNNYDTDLFLENIAISKK